jgi:hypothetical protein
LTGIPNKMAVKGVNYFPIIVGKRPSVLAGKENVASVKTDKQVSHMPGVRPLHNHHIISFITFFITFCDLTFELYWDLTLAIYYSLFLYLTP